MHAPRQNKEHKSFGHPDEIRAFPHGRAEILKPLEGWQAGDQPVQDGCERRPAVPQQSQMDDRK